MEISVQAAGADHDALVAKNWKKQWLANGREESGITADQMDKMLAYIKAARSDLCHQSFVAVSPSGAVVGSAACQLWSGPAPQFDGDKAGTVWGVFVEPEHRRRGVATRLMQAVIKHWTSIGCQRGVLLCASEEARRVYERLGFGPGHMLLLELQPSDAAAPAPSSVTLETAHGAEADAHVLRHLRAKHLEERAPGASRWAGEELPERAAAFVKGARERLEYAVCMARDATGAVVGCASSNVWEGPGSNNHSWQTLIKLGVVWGLHVDREQRERDAVAAALLEHVVARWRETGCTKGFVMAASDAEAALFRRAGFEAHNAMTIELGRAPSPTSPIDLLRGVAMRQRTCAAEAAAAAATAEAEADFVASLRASGAALAQQVPASRLALLRLALPQMVEAALPATGAGRELAAVVVEAQAATGTHIDPESNWYTKNIARFGGGFDMKALTAQPGLLAAKFDRMASKYAVWTVGNRCTYYDWIARSARAATDELRGEGAVLDVACGIGLPGHQLRLCGFEGHMSGTDLSVGMLARARERRVYNRLFLADANAGLAAVESESLDLVLCVGALELLDHAICLPEFARVLKPKGELWASFQWEDAVDESGAAIASPTRHQNVAGVTLSELAAKLEMSGFDFDTAHVEKSHCAFYTPSPAQDGSSLPVPYLYVKARLASAPAVAPADV